MDKSTKEKLQTLIDLLSKGMHFEKIVRLCTPTSGAVYLNKKYVGQKFHVYLIPIEPDPDTISKESSEILPQEIEDIDIDKVLEDEKRD